MSGANNVGHGGCPGGNSCRWRFKPCGKNVNGDKSTTDPDKDHIRYAIESVASPDHWMYAEADGRISYYFREQYTEEQEDELREEDVCETDIGYLFYIYKNAPESETSEACDGTIFYFK